MISNCANPACNKPFHYLRGGRLYRFDAPCGSGHSEQAANAVYTMSSSHCAVFFWLCKECSRRLSLKFDGRQVTVRPLNSPFQGNARHPIVAVGEWEINQDRTTAEPKMSSVDSIATPAADTR